MTKLFTGRSNNSDYYDNSEFRSFTILHMMREILGFFHVTSNLALSGEIVSENSLRTDRASLNIAQLVTRSLGFPRDYVRRENARIISR